MYSTPQGACHPNMSQQPMQPMSFDNTMGQQAQPMMQGQAMMYDPQMQSQPMYDPQMQAEMQALQQLQAQDAAAAELQRLEDKKAEKDKSRKDKEVHHIAHMMRSGNRNQEDNASCATMICFWGIFNGLLWAVPLLGDNWWNKVWHGQSVRKLEMCLGLFNMWVNVDCTGAEIETRLCDSMSKYANHNNGNWAVADMRDEMCLHVPGKCGVMNRLVQSAYPPLVCLPAAAGFEVLAILLLYFYWHGKPSGLARSMSLKLSVLAVFLGNVGFFGWMLWSPYMHELPRIWAEESGNKDFANSSIFGMKESFTMPMGWCSLMLVLGCLSSMLRFFVQWTLPFNIHEPDPYGLNSNGAEMNYLQEAEKMVNQA